MDFIYSISAQRNQGAPEIFYFTYSYENAIIFLYEFILKDEGVETINDSYSFDFYHLNKFPMVTVTPVVLQVLSDFNFSPDYDWSKVKMTKSSKYRIKFKNWGELKKEYLSCKRNEKLETILGE